MKTKETIAENINNLYDGHRFKILNHYRDIDESNLWPVCNNFNATQRAINRLYKFERESGQRLEGLELCYFIDSQLSDIVNNI